MRRGTAAVTPASAEEGRAPLSQRVHQKLVFERPAPHLSAFASLYRYGVPAGPAPALVYVGGTLSRKKYKERLHTEPWPVLVELEKALAPARPPRLDVLVLPCPVESSEEGLDAIVSHFDDELVPALGAPPSALGCVGYSAGALLAGYLGIVAEARALATFGGTGLPHAARAARDILQEAQRAGRPEVEVALFRNAGDPVADALAVATALLPPLHPRPMGERPGGHEFKDYAANGTVAEAFRFVLERLRSN